MFVGEGVLVLARQVVAAGIDKDHVPALLIGPAFLPAAVEDQDGHRNRGGREEVGRQADDRIQQVLLDHLLADTPLGRSAEQHAMGHNHGHAAFLFEGRFHHVADEGPVALALGRDAAPEAVVAVVLRPLRRPTCRGKTADWRPRRRTSSGGRFPPAPGCRACRTIRCGRSRMPCRNMFIRASAQVLPLTSMPKRAKLRSPTSLADLDQQAAGAAGRIADAVSRLGAGPAWPPARRPCAACRTRRPSCRRRRRSARSGRYRCCR